MMQFAVYVSGHEPPNEPAVIGVIGPQSPGQTDMLCLNSGSASFNATIIHDLTYPKRKWRHHVA